MQPAGLASPPSRRLGASRGGRYPTEAPAEPAAGVTERSRCRLRGRTWTLVRAPGAAVTRPPVLAKSQVASGTARAGPRLGASTVTPPPPAPAVARQDVKDQGPTGGLGRDQTAAELREQLSSYAGSLLAAGSPRVTSCISPHCHLRPSTQQGAGGTTMSQAEGEEAFEYCNVTINSQEKVLDVYTQLEKLGEGKFGMVYRLQEKATGKIRAGKYFRTRMPKERQAARAEVELMNLLHHPRLVQCLAAFQSPKELVMVMEYVAGGELFERIVDDDFEHTEPSSIQYMRQILEGLQYMHSQAIVHLDLKPENIVCVSPNSHWLKIIDFGLARKLTPDTPVKVLHGTPEFMAPEVVSFEPVGFTTDMWSIGVICYILLSGESPFQGDNDMETLSNVTAAKWEFEEETFSEISQQAKDFISQLLQKDARCRLSSKEALLHPWLQQLVPSSAKVLSKERIKQFLTRRKWQKTGRALLALNRLTLHSQNLDRKASDTQDEEAADQCCSPEEDQAFALPAQQGPSFSEPLADQEEVEGGSICLQCRIEDVPALEVTWLQDCAPLKDSPRVRIKHGADGCCSLTISELAPEDAGRYVCRAVTATGEAETSAMVAVLPPPRAT